MPLCLLLVVRQLNRQTEALIRRYSQRLQKWPCDLYMDRNFVTKDLGLRIILAYDYPTRSRGGQRQKNFVLKSPKGRLIRFERPNSLLHFVGLREDVEALAWAFDLTIVASASRLGSARDSRKRRGEWRVHWACARPLPLLSSALVPSQLLCMSRDGDRRRKRERRRDTGR